LAEFIWEFKPDKVTVLGDCFHKNEVELADIYRTNDWKVFKGIAATFPTEVIAGNHDVDLNPDDVTPALLVPPYLDAWGYYRSHWSEFDPIQRLPHWWQRWWAQRFAKTPYQLLQPDAGNPLYNLACQYIHTQMMNEHRYKGYLGGHTHMPMHLWLPDTKLDLWNCGDWVGSSSVVVRCDDSMKLITSIGKGGKVQVIT
jgi:hypothetical protein